MDVLNLLNIFNDKFKIALRLLLWIFILSIILSIAAYFLIQARTKLQKMKDDYEKEKEISLEELIKNDSNKTIKNQ